MTTTERGIEEVTWQDRFDAALEAPSTDGGFLYDLGEDYQSVDFDTDAIKEFIRQELQKAREEAQEEYKQFVLNVLNGVDIADGQCTTKAIRYALKSRV